jgi:dienelactone hydrolase
MNPTRELIASLIAVPPIPTPPVVRVLEELLQDNYSRSLVQYPTPDGDLVEAFMYEPLRPTPMAPVLVLHQHNSQWTIGKSEVAGLDGDPLQAFAPALARRGITVLAPDAIGFESRRHHSGSGTSLAPPLTRSGSTAEGWLQYYNEMAHRLVEGDLLMRKMILDSMTGVSVLHARNERSGAPVGAIGHSLGGISSGRS